MAFFNLAAFFYFAIKNGGKIYAVLIVAVF